MKDLLTLSCIQYNIQWEATESNIETLDKLISGIPPGTDLVILPEMFATGFSMNTGTVAEDRDGITLSWMKSKAKSTGAVILGSIPFRETAFFSNRLWVVYPNGKTSYYDKRHLFSYAGESMHYSRGNKLLEVDLHGWKIVPLLCYDLRFPVWSRNAEGYDLLIYLANWPASRMPAWKTLLAARAIENQCFVIGVNRTGTDGDGIRYNGNSRAIDAAGLTISNAGQRRELVQSLTLSMTELIKFRKEFPFLADKDNFTIHTK